MVKEISVSIKQASELKLIAIQIGAPDLENVYSHLEKEASKLVSPAQVRSSISEILGKEKGGILFRHIFALTTVYRRNRTLKTQNILDAITRELSKLDWSPDELEKWNSASPILQKLISIEPICIAAKAVDLTYDYSILLDKARILTDIRPIFSCNKTHLVGSIVAHSLRLDYTSENTTQSITLMLDTNDIELLQNSCAEALSKAEILEMTLEKECAIKVIDIGGDDA